MNDTYVIVDGELYHAGVKGMKWGVRRWQNEDGTLTPAGKARLAKYKNDEIIKVAKRDISEKAKDHKKWGELADKTDAVIAKYGRPSKQYSKASKAETSHVMQSLRRRQMAIKEIEAIKNMSFDQMTKEKKLAGQVYVRNALLTGGIGLLLSGDEVRNAKTISRLGLSSKSNNK